MNDFGVNIYGDEEQKMKKYAQMPRRPVVNYSQLSVDDRHLSGGDRHMSGSVSCQTRRLAINNFPEMYCRASVTARRQVLSLAVTDNFFSKMY